MKPATQRAHKMQREDFLKNQADLAVIRGTCIIQDAKGLYLFAKEKLETPKDSTNVRRRIFEYVEEIPREIQGYINL